VADSYDTLSWVRPCRHGVGQWVSVDGPERTRESHMIKVKARGSESVEQMLRRFKKMCEKEGLAKDVKRKAYYEKPSERKRRQARRTQKRTPV